MKEKFLGDGIFALCIISVFCVIMYDNWNEMCNNSKNKCLLFLFKYEIYR